MDVNGTLNGNELEINGPPILKIINKTLIIGHGKVQKNILLLLKNKIKIEGICGRNESFNLQKIII